MTQPPIEFSRPFPVERLGTAAIVETIEANATERAALAGRLGLVAIDRLTASVRLHAEFGRDLIRVTGRLEADVVQTCVITLEPFASHVEDEFTTDFSDLPVQPAAEITLDLDYEPPEPIAGGIIDIGELVAQYLALALDPHPRAPGVGLDRVWTEGEEAENLSPFAVLQQLKPRGS